MWQKGIELVVSIYRLTDSFPVHERYGLIAQLRRASVSVVANIAEGSARGGRREFRHYVSIARGSIREIETLLVISERLGYADHATAEAANRLTNDVARMLTRLSAALATAS